MGRWLSIGSPGHPYPASVRATRHRSGVYAIRDAETREVLYVGESHSARLYQTMTRHLQAWSDRKGSHGSPHAWHFSCAREQVEVRFETCLATSAVQRQDEWIVRLRPKYNARVPDEGVPF